VAIFFFILPFFYSDLNKNKNLQLIKKYIFQKFIFIEHMIGDFANSEGCPMKMKK